MNWIQDFFSNKRNAIILLVAASFTGLAASSGSLYFRHAKNLDIYASVIKEINTYYVDDVSPTKLVKKSIEGMCKSLDPYTVLLAENDITDYRLNNSEKHGSIGATICKWNDSIALEMVNFNSPAYKAGLRNGDVLLTIGGESVTGKSLTEINKSLVGSPGTAIEVKILQTKTNTTIIKNIVREDEDTKLVPYYGLIDDETGYVKFTSFMDNGSKEISNALDSLKLQSKKGLKSVVLDLRGNGGGLLTEAINIVNFFVPKNTLVVDTKGRLIEAQHTYKTLNDIKDAQIKVAVLTNHNSASASEIVSGSLQDLDRGVVVGQKTYGKGLVQVTKPISYGNQFKVTISKYYIPSGRCIQALDYSKRNQDGSVVKYVDSLKKTFFTKNGRKVFDGGGIEPDINVEENEVSLVAKALKQQNLYFGFAVKYFKEHNTILDARNFSISNSDFDDFINYLSDKHYNYSTISSKKLESLKKILEKENYQNLASAEIIELENKLKQSEKSDLQKHKSELIKEINKAIVGFYFQQKGQFENSFKTDNELQQAITVLHDDVKYKQILAIK
jgi:carboxyl-terminal processing protease